MQKDKSRLSLSKKKSIEALFVALLVFFLTSPYFFWAWYGNLFVSIVVSSTSLLFFWKNRERLNKQQRIIYTFFVFVWLLYLINEFFKGARLGVVAYLPYVLLGLVPFIKKEFGKTVYNYFVTLYAIVIGLSMLSWIAAMTGILSPIGELGAGIESLEAQNKSYIVYPLSLVSLSNISDFTRFCGIFDEPGVVGTLAGLILCGLRFNMRDWRAIIVFLSGLLSTSMFFYGIALVYWLVQLLFVKKKVGYVFLIVAGIFVTYSFTKDIPVVSYLVWDRFEWDSSRGGFVGNTREGDQVTYSLKKMISTGEIWLGVKDKEAYWIENFGSASIYNLFAMNGLVFSILYILWLVVFGYYYKTNRIYFLLYCFVVAGCLYQRPNMFDLPFTFLFVSVARFLDFNKDNRVITEGLVSSKKHRISENLSLS